MVASVDDIQQIVQSAFIVMFSKTYCPYCSKLKALLQKLQLDARIVELDAIEDGRAMQNALSQVSQCNTVPQLFVGGKFVGGCDDVHRLHDSGKFLVLVNQRRQSWQPSEREETAPMTATL
ncbi:Glutaredoxin domain-containing protein [Plasmodiophora brassicae]|uniref:Glutaredoxin domain-containing protein n=1 Tax=Plasmodiophora brassicae TaxID=37360 RepID=A0A3P3YFY1_PLABS|nr:unnamed protein product [Plasmodiophora brassicae]